MCRLYIHFHAVLIGVFSSYKSIFCMQIFFVTLAELKNDLLSTDIPEQLGFTVFHTTTYYERTLMCKL